jgi:methyltransferase (TIGR00027 family)
MRDDTPSRTAAWVAAARHLGRLLPEQVRLADDPYGAQFTSPLLARAIEEAIDHDGAATSRLGQTLRALRHPVARMPGLRQWILYMQVRTRVIDDWIRAWVARGGTQLLVLGAGYDTRALRLPDLANVHVFEVDHPATQNHKVATLERIDAPSPATYIAWDFEERPIEDMPDALAEVGHDRSAPTFTIWEGVTMYLSEPAIDASLRAIAEWSAPRSELAMTYFAKRAQPTLIARAIQTVVASLGEPFRWSWSPEELPEYLAVRGLDLLDDISLADAARRLLPPELAIHVSDHDRRVALAGIAAETLGIAQRIA